MYMWGDVDGDVYGDDDVDDDDDCDDVDGDDDDLSPDYVDGRWGCGRDISQYQAGSCKLCPSELNCHDQNHDHDCYDIMIEYRNPKQDHAHCVHLIIMMIKMISIMKMGMIGQMIMKMIIIIIIYLNVK